MKPKTKSLTWTVALAAVLSIITALPCTAQLLATDLGVLAGSANSHATAMNSSG